MSPPYPKKYITSSTFARVNESECVAELVQTREIHDRLAEQRIAPRPSRDVVTERAHVGANEHLRAAAAADDDRAHLAVLSVVRPGPIETNESVGL